MDKMIRIYFYKGYKLLASDASVIVVTPEGFTKGTYYYTGAMCGRNKESIVKFLKRRGVL